MTNSISTPPSTTTILGIDCGTAITGWSVLQSGSKNNRVFKLVAYGIIETHKLTPEVHRLADLGDSVLELINEYKPTELAIEDIFFFKNAKTVIKVSQARGVVLYQAVKSGLNCTSYTPLQVKQQLTGHGKADKKQILFMVNKLFSLDAKLTQDDAADAIAIAYCHALNLLR